MDYYHLEPSRARVDAVRTLLLETAEQEDRRPTRRAYQIAQKPRAGWLAPIAGFGIAGVVVLGLVVGLTTLGQHTRPATSAATDSGCVATTPSTTSAAGYAAALESHFRHLPGWAGVEINDARGEVRVHYVGAPPACLAAVLDGTTRARPTIVPTSTQATPQRLTAVVVPARFTRAELDAVSSRIGRARADLERRGIRLVTWGANVSKNRVEVHLRQSTPALERQLRKRFGEAVVVGADTAATTA